MANTGYKINPQVIQVFTTGPSSGSVVDPSFTVTFNSGSGFTSASLCNQSFYYRVYDPAGCIVEGVCIPPIIHTISVQNCEIGYDYVYQFALEAGPDPVPNLRVEYSLNSDFSGEVKGTTITDYVGSTIAPLDVNISTGLTNRSETSSSGLIGLPLNQYDSVYFRAYSICSGSNSSSYSNIQEGKCPEPTDYCVVWEAHNESNIKMSTLGYIDFSAMLAGRTINTGVSVGTITGYVIAGVGTIACEIDMSFTTSQASWETDLLPAVTDKVLTSLIYTVNIIFNNASEFDIIDGQTNAIVTPGQLDSFYDSCN